MDMPLQITFHDMDASDAVAQRIRERVEELEQFFPHIVGCRVVVEMPHRRHRQGQIFHITAIITVPGHEIVVGRERTEHHAHEDVYVAIRGTFDAARRQLEDVARKMHGAVKYHEAPSHGHVARLFRQDGYGFIESRDGQEIYFHRNSVAGDFERLEEGDEVRFVAQEAESDKGPQASTVTPMGKHHP